MRDEFTPDELARAARFRAEAERMWWLTHAAARAGAVDLDALLGGADQPHVRTARDALVAHAIAVGVSYEAVGCILGLTDAGVSEAVWRVRRANSQSGPRLVASGEGTR